MLYILLKVNTSQTQVFLFGEIFSYKAFKRAQLQPHSSRQGPRHRSVYAPHVSRYELRTQFFFRRHSREMQTQNSQTLKFAPTENTAELRNCTSTSYELIHNISKFYK